MSSANLGYPGLGYQTKILNTYIHTHVHIHIYMSKSTWIPLYISQHFVSSPYHFHEIYTYTLSFKCMIGISQLSLQLKSQARERAQYLKILDPKRNDLCLTPNK